MFPYALFVVHVLLAAIGVAFVTLKIITPNACVRAVSYPMTVWIISAMAASVPEARFTTHILGWIAVVVTVLMLLIGTAEKLDGFRFGRKSGGSHDLDCDAPNPQAASHPPALVKAAGAVLPNSATPTIEEVYGDRRVIRFEGEIGSFATNTFMANCLDAIMDGAKRLLVQVSTSGGSVDSGWQMHEQLRLLTLLPDVDVRVLVVGSCESAGVLFIMGVPVENRWATTNSSFMIHSCKIKRDGLAVDSTALVQADADLLGQYNSRIVKLLARDTAFDRRFLKGVFAGHDEVRFSAQQALEHGVIGGII